MKLGSILRLGVVIVSVAKTTACSEAPAGPVTNEISGDWLFTEQLQGAADALVCYDTARVRVVQSNARFSIAGYQSGACRIGTSVWVPNSGEVDVSDGRIGDASSVTFSFGGCRYTGAIASGDAALSGDARCTVSSPGGSITATGSWRMGRADFLPPTVTGTLSPSVLSHGDTIQVSVQAQDSVGLAYVGASISFDRVVYSPDCPTDRPPVRDSVAVSGKSAERAFRYMVPGCTWYVSVSVFAGDTAGHRADVAVEPREVTFPVTQISGTLDDTVYTLGDTVRISVTATNARGLGYVGYRWYIPNFAGQDSIPVSGTSASPSLNLAIPFNAPVTQLMVRLFARHQLGWLTEFDLPWVRTTDAIQLPLIGLELPGTPNDVTYASLSDRLYFTDPTTAVVREVMLSPLSLGGTYPIPTAGVSLDLSRSEDSLLVGLKGQLAFAMVRRSGGSAVTVPIIHPDEINLYEVRRIRVAGNGRAMVHVWSGGSGHVVEVDPSDGSQRVRIPWYGYATFDRNSDRSRLLFIDPPDGRLYVASSDTFLPPQSGVIRGCCSISGDAAATQWLVGFQLLTADMVPIRVLTDPSVDYGPSALATEGDRAYCARRDGFVEFDASSGERVRAVWLPSRPDYLRALPGHRVVALSGNALYLVTLP